MSDSEYSDVGSHEEKKEEVTDLTNEAVVTKYRTCADITNGINFACVTDFSLTA